MLSPAANLRKQSVGNRCEYRAAQAGRQQTNALQVNYYQRVRRYGTRVPDE